MVEVLVKTYSRNRDQQSLYYLKDWTAFDVLSAKPDGYYTSNKYGGAKKFGVVLCINGYFPEDYILQEAEDLFESLPHADPDGMMIDYGRLKARSKYIIDLSMLPEISDQKLKDLFNHDLMVAPITINGSYLDVLKSSTERTGIHPYDKSGTYYQGNIDVGPNGDADANDFYEFESNIGNLTGDLTGTADEAHDENNNIVIDGFTLGGYTLTFACSGAGKHPGYIPGSPTHYRITPATSGQHVITCNVDVTLDGMDLAQDADYASATGGSEECVRVSNGVDVTVKNCIVRAGYVANAQDGIYAAQTSTVNIENTMAFGFGRAGFHAQNYSAGHTLVFNINSCFVTKTGEDAEPVPTSTGVSYGSGITGRCYTGSTVNINVFNTVSIGNYHHFSYVPISETPSSGARYSETWDFTDMNKHDTALSGHIDCVWDIHNCICGDNSITGASDVEGCDPSAVGCLEKHNVTDDNSKASDGDWVIIENFTSYPYDCRLQNNTYNEAQDMHVAASGAGMSMPSTDLIGTSRPFNTNYDCGAFEWILNTLSIDVAELFAENETLD